MKIKLKAISVKDLVAGYKDSGDDGVVGYGGKLDIRPPYQREFIYTGKQRDAVINTVINDFPLNVMYWAVREDGDYEIIDGQQRTISICQYVNRKFSFEDRSFHNLQNDEKVGILNYKLMVYFCSGTDSEKLNWFKTINIAGEELTNQELRNAVYSGSWVTHAKTYFSKSNCPAQDNGGKYLKGAASRQEYLETAIKWLSDGKIESYMGEHQHDDNALELWGYFNDVIEWVEAIFTTYRKPMKGVDWGTLYRQCHDKKHDPEAIEKETAKLIADDDVKKLSGIYPYILTRDEKHLSLRAFTDSMKQKVYEKQQGNCPKCKKQFVIDNMEGDHVTPWSEGGKTSEENCQMLCKECNRRKSNK